MTSLLGTEWIEVMQIINEKAHEADVVVALRTRSPRGTTSRVTCSSAAKIVRRTGFVRGSFLGIKLHARHEQGFRMHHT
jgi:hypothetical protein